jgi:hypothetical protein
MKHLILPICFALLPLSLHAADVCSLNSGGYKMGPNAFFGATTCKNGKADSISVNGTLTVENATLNVVSVDGPLIATKSTLGNVTVHGPFTATGSTIDSAVVSGDTTLKNSKIKTLTIPDHALIGEHKVYLENKTVVKGNITFSKGQGKIYKSADSTLAGKAVGSSIVKL